MSKVVSSRTGAAVGGGLRRARVTAWSRCIGLLGAVVLIAGCGNDSGAADSDDSIKGGGGLTANQGPVVTITSPTSGTTFKAGDTLTITAQGTDPEDGNLPATQLTWWVNQHHDAHTHPVQLQTTGSGGAITLPVRNETSDNIWLRIHVRATDSAGLTVEATHDVLPVKSQFTLATDPPGLQLTLDGQGFAAPRTVTGVVGTERDVGAPDQELNGRRYRLVGWSDDGEWLHTLATPAANATYTATFADNGPATNQLPAASLTAPSTAGLGTEVTLIATATDSDGTITQVQFLEGSTVVGTDTTAPYSMAWTPATTGPRSLSVRATDNAGAVTTSAAVSVSVSQPEAGGLLGTYFANTTLTGAPVLTRVEAVDFVWSASAGTTSPGPGLPADGWSVRWIGYVQLPATGSYTFQVVADDGARVWIDGQAVANRWVSAGNTTYQSQVFTGTAGTQYPVVIEHYDGGGDSTVKLRWKIPSQPLYWSSVPVAHLLQSSAAQNNPPSATLSAPGTATTGVAVTLSATATDSDGTVARVEFLDGSTVLGTDAEAPYSVTWIPATAGTRTLMARVTDNDGAVTSSAAVSATVLQPQPGGLQGTYFANTTLTGAPVLTRVETVDFVWATATGTSVPGPGLPADGWSVRWTGYVQLPATGSYTLQVIADDGARVWINGQSVADKWTDGGNTTYQAPTLTGTAGMQYPVQLEHYDGGGDSTVKLRWKAPSQPLYWVPVPAEQLYQGSAAQNEPPSVTLTAPTTASAGTAIAISATAADSDGTVEKVDFFDNTTLIGTATTAPYSVSWAPQAAGGRTLTARATDNAGAVTTSTAIAVEVSQTNLAPTASFVAPATATTGVAVTLTATATDDDGAISQVQFLEGSTVVGTDTTAPYSVAWTPATAGTSSLSVRATDDAGAVTTSAAVSVTVSQPLAGGLLGTYFANTTLTGTPVLTRVEVVDFVWAGGTASPGPGLPADGWSVRWTGYVQLPTTGSYTFQVTADDGARVWINGQPVADKWTAGGNTTYQSQTFTGTAGTQYPVVIEHNDIGGDSTVKLRWQEPSLPQYWVAVPSARLYQTSVAPNNAPTATISAPGTATVGVAVTLSATASDSDGTVSLVQFLDGGTVVGTDATAPYSVTWTPAAAGTRSLTARATDNAGALGTSAALLVNVGSGSGGDTQAPSATLTAPANLTDNISGNLTLSASANDNVGVVGVEFQVDGVRIGNEDIAAPYSTTVDSATYTTGQHIVRARARDAAGNFSPWATATVRFDGSSYRSVPVGFTRNESWVTGLGAATAFTQAADGRMFIAIQDGRLLVVKNGSLLATPFLNVAVDASGERGLLGVTLHPNFATNGWIYVYYTRVNGSSRNNRVSRFVASGDVSTGVETVIVDLPNLSGSNHNGGAMQFGLDGKLYVAVGDNANTTKPQNLNDPFGKMLRFNENGSIPSDNPFCTTVGNIACAVWAYGLRNPYTFAIQPGTGRMHINDVGRDLWEEVNLGAAGANYGWPASEGPDNITAGITAPIFAYKHSDASPPGSGPGGFFVGNAIIGAGFYPNSGPFPAQYRGKYFFAEYVYRFVGVLDTANGNMAYTFANIADFPVGLLVGQDGAVYVLGRDNIVRISTP